MREHEGAQREHIYDTSVSERAKRRGLSRQMSHVDLSSGNYTYYIIYAPDLGLVITVFAVREREHSRLGGSSEGARGGALRKYGGVWGEHVGARGSKRQHYRAVQGRAADIYIYSRSLKQALYCSLSALSCCLLHFSNNLQ